MLTARFGHNGEVQTTSTTWLIRLAMVCVVLAGTLGWIATGNIGGASADGLRATDQALGRAAELADTTAALATELQKAVSTLSNGMRSASEAIDHTIEVSKNVRTLLDTVSVLGVPVIAGADILSTNLAQAEEALLEVQGGLNEAFANLKAVVPTLAASVSTVQAIPNELRAAQNAIRETTDEIDRGVVLWRVALVLGAVALLLLLVVADRIVRSMQPPLTSEPVTTVPETTVPETTQP